MFSLVLKISSGYLVFFGHLAHCANQEYGLNLGHRNTVWLRRELLNVIGHDTDIPIHRISTQDDAEPTKDYSHTQGGNRQERTAKGTYPPLKWQTGSF